MTRLTILLCLGFALAAPARAGTSLESTAVTLKATVMLDDPVLRLGDLFYGLDESADIAVARAPAPGRSVELDARWLSALAQGYGIPWRPNSGFAQVVVSRASRAIDATQIEDALRSALAARGAAGDLTVLLDNPAQRLHLPTEAAASLAVAGLAYDPTSGRFRAHLVAPAEGPPAVRSTVTGQAVRMTQVPVLAHQLAPGAVIGRGDLDWLNLRADRVPGNVVVDYDNLLGKSPRRAIRPGQPVRRSDLREPVLVARNSLVVLRLELNRMVLTAQGRALEDGAAGEVIRVRNTKSNTVVSGVVAETGTVRVRTATLEAANR